MFDPSILIDADRHTALMILGSEERLAAPDLIIAPDGNPYLYRWWVIPHNNLCGVYFHIQVADDPERPLHDHPFDNTSTILAGGFLEKIDTNPEFKPGVCPTRRRRPGDVVFRQAEWAHRLFLPEGVPYSMSLFTTGPHRRDWGFWFPDGWRSQSEVIVTENGKSEFRP